MAGKAKEKRSKDLIRRMIRMRRTYIPPEWIYVAENDVDFMETYNKLYDRALSEGRLCRQR